MVQPKSEIGQPGDQYEQEADAVADRVMRMPATTNAGDEEDGMLQPKLQPGPYSKLQMSPLPSNPMVQLKCAECEEGDKVQMVPLPSNPLVQRKDQPAIQMSADGTAHATPEVASQLSQTKGSGQKLPDDLQQDLGGKMGADFSNVKVHTDSTAAQLSQDLGAKAFTHGQDVYFNKGNYNPSSSEGKHLLAHELTHTVQQGGQAVYQRASAPRVQMQEDPPHKFVKAGSTSKEVSDAIVGDLDAAIAKVLELTGTDLGAEFGDTKRNLSQKTTKVGADNFSWHKTGRAIDLWQGAKWVITEDPQSSGDFFRLYLKASDQESTDPYVITLAKETDGGPKLHYQGINNPTDYKLIDVTAIFEDLGFTRIKAHSGWEKASGYNKREWWHYEKRDGLTMYQAFQEVYTDDQITEGVDDLVSSRHSHGGRLHREGFTPEALKAIWDNKPITHGGLSLYFSVGDNRDCPNIPDDMAAMKTAFKTLGYTWKPELDPRKSIPITDFDDVAKNQYKAADLAVLFSDKNILRDLINKFQSENGISPDGYVTVGGATHKKMGDAIEETLKD